MNKTKLLFLLIIQFVFSQNDNVHGLNIGLLNQVTILSYHYEHFFKDDYRVSIGYSSRYGTFKKEDVDFKDDALLISFHYLFGENKKYSIGLGSSQQFAFSNIEFHAIASNTTWFGNVYIRSSINFILNEHFYKNDRTEMDFRPIYFASLNLGYTF